MEIQNPVKSYPFYFKATIVLVGIIAFVFLLYILGDILVPFAIAGLVAILLNPMNNRFERTLPRVVAIFLSITVAIIVLGSIIYFLSVQVTSFSDMLPVLKQKFFIMLDELQQWTKQKLGISINKQVEMISGASQSGQQLLGRTLGTILGMFSVVVLIPIYVFLLLYYKPLILDFLYQVFKEENSLRVAEILGQTKGAIQSYIIGLLIETAIVAALNSVALLILGVPNAILLGVIGGILNILPYIGGVVAILLPVIMVTVTREGHSLQLAVIGAYLVIQFVDNNILVPRIVSSKVQINALISIIVVLMGAGLWGISGMFLAIPFIAVLKIVFDRVEALKPWGHLLGDKVPETHSGVEWQKKWNRIFRRLEQNHNAEGK